MQRLTPGTRVLWQGRQCVVEDLQGLSSAVVRRVQGKRLHLVPLSELSADIGVAVLPTIHGFSPRQWERAADIFSAIAPLLARERYDRGTEAVRAAAAKLGCQKSAIYNYLTLWSKSERLSCLVRKSRSDQGKFRISADVQKVIVRTVDDFDARPERAGVVEMVKEVQRLCRQAGLPIPSKAPVVAELRRREGQSLYKARPGRKMARPRPAGEAVPGADVPLALVQIDHATLEIQVVDDLGNAMGRPTLTVVFDVCTRMLCGYSISLEPPGPVPAALALAHALLPKDDWARRLGVNVQWPIWGRPRKVLVDDAEALAGSALERGCGEHGIVLAPRPRGQLQHGSHIERSFRRHLRALQRLAGRTISTLRKKVRHDAAGRPCLSLRDCERWFAYYAQKYHSRRHPRTGQPPQALYEKHALGDGSARGMGPQRPFARPERVLLDFLEPFQHVVEADGVHVDGLTYWDDCLRPWARAKDPADPAKRRTFSFVRDPRDLGVLYFWEPQRADYVAIANRDRQDVSLGDWALPQAAGMLVMRHDEPALHAALHALRDLDESTGRAEPARRLSVAGPKAGQAPPPGKRRRGGKETQESPFNWK